MRGELPADDHPAVAVDDEAEVHDALPAADLGVGVGPGRGAGVPTGPFPRPALRTGLARFRASGSPRDHAVSAHGVGIFVPRYRKAGSRPRAVGLLAVYAGQELLEGLFATGHPQGLVGIFGDGGLWVL